MRSGVKKSMMIAIPMVVALGVGVAATTALSSKFDAINAYEKVGKSKESLLKYKEDNEAKIKKINTEINPQEKIFVTITFLKPLNENQVSKLISDYTLEVDYSIARIVEEDGTRGTLFSSQRVPGIKRKDLISQQTVEQVIAGSKSKGKYKGIIEIVARVPNSKLQALAANESIFLVDPSADKSLVSNPNNDYMPGAFWDLEDYNLTVE